jgi:predicted acylesterase/phospholipase RssA
LGITIVHKSEGQQQKAQQKVALVLAGGAISGGAFKVGGLMALNRFLGKRSVEQLDIYVGISAGAFLAAPLSAGVPGVELLRAIWGRSDRITPFRPSHFYWPNFAEYVQRPAKLAKDSMLFGPELARDVARKLVYQRRRVIPAMKRILSSEHDETLRETLAPILADLMEEHPVPFSLDYLPSGLFDNKRIEKYIRDNFERNGLPNNFRLLRLERGADLYIGATNLETGGFDVFGPDDTNPATISQAVQASTAIPGFFKPARVRGTDYMDGSISKTASMSVAASRGADLIIAYNPFRPYVPTDIFGKKDARSLKDSGALTVLNQAFRTMLHTRLHLGVEKLRLDPNFKGDIILIEPSASDLEFFNMNPLNFWSRSKAASYGFKSVKEGIESQYPLLKEILNKHGFSADLEGLQTSFIKVARAQRDEEMIDTLEDVADETSQRKKPSLKVVRTA